MLLRVKKIYFGLERNQICFWCVEKIAFGQKNSNMCLLNKTKSFGFKKYQIYFLRTKKKKIVCVKKKKKKNKSVLYWENKSDL